MSLKSSSMYDQEVENIKKEKEIQKNQIKQRKEI